MKEAKQRIKEMYVCKSNSTVDAYFIFDGLKTLRVFYAVTVSILFYVRHRRRRDVDVVTVLYLLLRI